MSKRRYTLYRCEEGPPPSDGGAGTRSAAVAAEASAASGRTRAAGDPDRGRRNSGAGNGRGNGGGGGRKGGRADGAGNGDDPQGAPPRQVYAKPRRRWVGALRYVALVLVAAICGIAGYWWGWLDSTVAQVGKNDKPAVEKARGVLDITAQTAGEPINILVLGSDRRDDIPDDPGRSDTMMLLRLDPITKSISMFSVPRDLWVDIPGYGSERINVAYTLGKQKGAIQVFKQLTGQPIHHFIDVNFLGFIRIVDTLGGVYIDVDQRYYNPPGTGWSAIDLSPGYQLLNGRHALMFVRFRHDDRGDFGRMLRQQVFLHEVERQAKRWQNFSKLPGIVKAVSKNTISDIDDLTQALGLAKLMLGLNTSHVYKTHVEGEGTMIDGKAVQLPSQQEIKDAVSDFLDPQQAPVVTGKISIPRDTYAVRVLNGSGTQGLAGQVAADLKSQGYSAAEDGNADAFDYTNSVVFTTAGLETSAEAVARMLQPCRVQVVKLLPGTLDGMTVVVGSKYTGVKEPPDTTSVVQAQIQKGVNQDAASWRTWQSKVGIPLEMPTAWSPGMVYDLDQWRFYTIKTPDGQRAAFVAVGHTVSGGYWHVQAMSWTDPPILTDPSEERTIDGRKYRLYYQGARLHRVAWRNGSKVYWITNTLDDQIANKVLLELATSSKAVR